MGIFSYIKSKFSQLFGIGFRTTYDDSKIINGAQSFPKSIDDNFRNQIRNIIHEIHQVFDAANSKDFTIGVIGNFSVGKSSFINALLGDKVAPVSANPCTGIITKIKFGHNPKAEVHYKDNRNIDMSYDEYFDFSAFNINDFRERKDTGKIQRFEDIINASIFINSDLLKINNLCIVDTLGLYANESDNLKTIASIKNAIAIIYVCGERGFTNNDVEFISTYLDIGKSDIFVCINRIDLVKKSERENLKLLTKSKLDDILQKAGYKKEFPLERIYQISALYQDFANGFTNHEKWRKGIDYKIESGFLPLINDICEYIKLNERKAREKALNKQLETACVQIKYLQSHRKNEVDNSIKRKKLEIESANEKISKAEEQIKHINTLFQNLEQSMYSLIPNLFNNLANAVGQEWDSCKANLLNNVSFDTIDFFNLKADILALKINIFKSMSDERFAKLKSLTPFVEQTLNYLQNKLKLIIDQLNVQFKNLTDKFISQNSFFNIVTSQPTLFTTINFNSVSNLLQDTQNAMYRAIALTATESVWMRNSTRKEKMLNAAKNESLKVLEKPFRENIQNSFQGIKHNIEEWNNLAIDPQRTIIEEQKKEKNKIQECISTITKQWKEETNYYLKLITTIENSIILSK